MIDLEGKKVGRGKIIIDKDKQDIKLILVKSWKEVNDVRVWEAINCSIEARSKMWLEEVVRKFVQNKLDSKVYESITRSYRAIKSIKETLIQYFESKGFSYSEILSVASFRNCNIFVPNKTLEGTRAYKILENLEKLIKEVSVIVGSELTKERVPFIIKFRKDINRRLLEYIWQQEIRNNDLYDISIEFFPYLVVEVSQNLSMKVMELIEVIIETLGYWERVTFYRYSENASES